MRFVKMLADGGLEIIDSKSNDPVEIESHLTWYDYSFPNDFIVNGYQIVYDDGCDDNVKTNKYASKFFKKQIYGDIIIMKLKDDYSINDSLYTCVDMADADIEKIRKCVERVHSNESKDAK